MGEQRPARLVDQDTLLRSDVVANNAMNRERQLSGVNSYARELGLDPVDVLSARRRLLAHLREAGFSYDPRRRRISCLGPVRAELPYTYLGADDRAGANYTGQPAVDSHYLEHR